LAVEPASDVETSSTLLGFFGGEGKEEVVVTEGFSFAFSFDFFSEDLSDFCEACFLPPFFLIFFRFFGGSNSL
jgi:hypothetical protein